MTTENDSKKEAPTRHRVQLDFSPHAFQVLDHLLQKSDFRSRAELIRNALRLLEWFLDKTDEGYAIRLVKDDKQIEVELFF